MNKLSNGPRPCVSVDSVLAQRARGGDREAFGCLFLRYHPAIVGFFQRRLGSTDAAREAAQETFLRAFARVGTLRSVERVRSWLFAFAYNVLREARRRGEPPAGALADEAELATALDATPEALLLGSELEEAADAALARLPAPRRAALMMRLVC